MTASAQNLFDQGRALHQQGRLDDARQHYEAALAADPAHAQALHLLGVFCIQTGRLEQGAALIERSLEIQPGDGSAEANLANALNGLGRHAEALEHAERAIALSPGDAAAHGNRGRALQAMERSAEALESYDRVTTLQPGGAKGHFNRGVVLQALGRLAEAVEAHRRAVALQPTFFEPLRSLGLILRVLGRPGEALAAYDAALALKPDHAETIGNRGNVLCDLKRPAEALEAHDAALALNPADPEVWSNRMVALRDLRRPDEALESCERALALQPGYAEGHNNRGGALYEFQRLDEALQAFDRAIALQPGLASAHLNRAVLLFQQRRFDEAMTAYETALSLNPGDPEIHYNQAVCRLAMGQEAGGWRQYEWRWKARQFEEAVRDLPMPLWLGEEDLTGRTILLHAEQGLGDALQFCRYAPAVAARGAVVVLEAQRGLERLMARLPGVHAVVTRGAPLPDCDFHTPLMSLPLALRAGAGDHAAPYLSADPVEAGAWGLRLMADQGLKVGLCWAGGARPDQPIAHAIDLRRSLPLEAFKPLAGLDGVSLYSLQKGPPAAELQAWDGPPIHDLTAEWRDFADTAAFIANLDLVIACDTSTAHLAGGMGKPVWMLNRFDTCWRWLNGRADTPWYPTARLFTQSEPGDWVGVMAEVRQALDGLASEKPNSSAR